MEPWFSQCLGCSVCRNSRGRAGLWEATDLRGSEVRLGYGESPHGGQADRRWPEVRGRDLPVRELEWLQAQCAKGTDAGLLPSAALEP